MAGLEEHDSNESRVPLLLDDYSESESSLCCFFLQVLIVLGFFSVVIWVSVTPKSPIYLITNAYIPALDARNNSTSNHSHNTSFFLNLEFFNPNKKMSIFYSDICITLYYSTSSTDADHLIGSSSLPGFYQGYKETTPYEVNKMVSMMNAKEVECRTDEAAAVIFREVLGHRSGYSRGLGHSVLPEKSTENGVPNEEYERLAEENQQNRKNAEYYQNRVIEIEGGFAAMRNHMEEYEQRVNIRMSELETELESQRETLNANP